MSLRTLPLLELNTDRAARQAGESRAVALTASTQRAKSQRMLVVAILAIAALMACLATRVSGQQAKNFPYDSIAMPAGLKVEANAKKVQSVAQRFASSGQGNASWVNGYFSVYVPAKMTAPDGVKYISELMDETRTMLSRAQRSRPQAAAAMTRYIFAGMKKVAEGNHHPAARINAALMLGRLDQTPANSQTRTPPVPLIQSLPILLNLYLDENNVDGVRAAALQGMHRQVQYGFPRITGAGKTQIVDAMNQLLDSDPPEGRSTEAHAYLKRFAVDILAALGQSKDSDLGVKLISISTEETNPDLIALYSASRLGTMGADLQGKVANPEKILRSWSKRALAAFEGELNRMLARERPKSVTAQPTKPEQFLEKVTEKPKDAAKTASSMDSMYGMDDLQEDGEDDMMADMMDMMDMGGMEMDMMGMMGGAPEAKPQPPVVIAARRKINSALQQIHLGVTGNPAAGMPSRAAGGLLASVAADKKKVVEDWVSEMQPIVDAINEDLLDDEEKFIAGLEEQIEALKKLIGDDPIEEEPLLPVDPAASDPAAADPAAADPLDAASVDAGPADALGS